MNENNWVCTICQHEIQKGEPFFYSSGTDRQIEWLECEVELLNSALTHIILKHLMEGSELS